MNRRSIVALAISAVAVAGCAGSMPVGDATIDVEAIQAQAAEIDRFPINRDGVHALMGEPWLASEKFGVEVYRLQGKQRNLMVIFAPYPVPLPFMSDKIEAYTLVAYDADGNVSARASDYVHAAPGEPPTLILSAGEFRFLHFLRDSLTVSLARYTRFHAADNASPSCTIFLGADPVRLAAADTGGFCTSAANLYLDGGKRKDVWLVSPAIIPPSRTSDADCRNAGGNYEVFTSGGPGACVFKHRTLYPLTLPVGHHELRFATGITDKGVTSQLDCVADKVTFATLTGKFILCMRQEDGRLKRDQPTDEGIQLSEQPPGTVGELHVIINDNGTWLYPAASRTW